jgi:hypothetical protein
MGKQLKYNSINELLERHGKTMLGGPITRPARMKQGIPKACHYNAYQIVKRNPARYVYAEGIAVPHNVPVPIEHAWVIDRLTGHVIEPTLPELAADYHGVAIRPEVVKAALKENHKTYSVLWNWMGTGMKLVDGRTPVESIIDRRV